jgi:hypothetical protein
MHYALMSSWDRLFTLPAKAHTIILSQERLPLSFIVVIFYLFPYYFLIRKTKNRKVLEFYDAKCQMWSAITNMAVSTANLRAFVRKIKSRQVLKK